uniref:Nucleoside diphosphate kinase B n=1 Tax=Mola mola TaxID=94237 RepID=A0A3Q3XI33_MOLML
MAETSTRIYVERTLALIKPDAIHKAEEIEDYILKSGFNILQNLLRGLTEVCKQKPLNPCIWLADWLIKNNPNVPQICEETFDGSTAGDTSECHHECI